MEDLEFRIGNNKLGSPRIIILVTNRFDTIRMDFSRQPDELPIVEGHLEKIMGVNSLSDDDEEIEGDFPQIISDFDKYEKMHSQIRSWRGALVFFAIIDLIGFWTIDPSLGITLLIVAVISFFIRESPIFVVFAGTLMLVGLNNMVGSGFGINWIIFGGYQIYLGTRAFLKFRYFHRIEKQHLAMLKEQDITPNFPTGRAQRFFPGLGCLTSSLSLIVLLAVVSLAVVAVAISVESGDPIADAPALDTDDSFDFVFNFVFGLIQGLGMIGFSMSVASLMANLKPKWMGWGGTIAGALLMLLNFILVI